MADVSLSVIVADVCANNGGHFSIVWEVHVQLRGLLIAATHQGDCLQQLALPHPTA